MARTYNKTSPYWEQRKAGFVAPAAAPASTIINTVAPAPVIQSKPFPDVSYGATEANASAVPSSGSSGRGPIQNNPGTEPDAFANIRAMPVPYAGFGDNRAYTGVKDAVELCMRAYSGVPAIRNAIEIATEFSNQPLHIKTSNETVRIFFREWFHAIEMHKLKEEFFREYYRSGNVFIYKFSGKFGPSYYKNLQEAFGARDNRIPIRYSLLNPASVFVPTGLTFPYTYTRLLSIYDIERLRHPMTDQDKQVFNDLPQFVKDQIKQTAAYPLGIFIPMDPERLRFAFYKKQSYEPLATPMCFPVLPSVEWKLALTKMDRQLARTIEHAILLVTTGETGTQYNGSNGINPNNIARLQNIFTNQTIGRVLVADFTTKAKWVIPPLEQILGPDKYEVVNQDILDGLQSIMGGKDQDKFANAQTKAKIFIQRLKEGQEAFLHNFLMPEIIQVCADMGFRTVPKISFREIDLQDDTVVARIYSQLGQLGILTAKQVVKAIETGILPDADEMDADQIEYQKVRDKGQYLPLVGASIQDGPQQEGGGAMGRPPTGAGTGPKIPNKKPGQIGVSKSGEAFSVKAYADNLRASQTLVDEVAADMKKRFKVKDLNESQARCVDTVADIIMATEPRKRWSKVIASTIKNPVMVPTAIANELDEIMTEHNVDNRDAILLRLSKTKAPSDV
jgi:hypothetical protein